MSHLNIPIQTCDFVRLVKFLESVNSKSDPVDMVSHALDYWIENASINVTNDDFGMIPGREIIENAEKGYQWKELFLPHNTIIKMTYRSTSFYAKIIEDRFVYENKQLSPSSFANHITGTSRNAWRDLWIKRPFDFDYRLADDLRNNFSELL